MFRLALLLLLISTAVYAESVTTHNCDYDMNRRINEVKFTVNNIGDTLDVNPLTFQTYCQGFDNGHKDSFVRVAGPPDANFYILFTQTHLKRNQKVSIVDVDKKMTVLAKCEGDEDSNFCPPIVLLKNEFYLRMSPDMTENDLKVVIVSTTKIPYYYYAYSQLPAWATVMTVFITFVFLFLMTLMCCCCVLMMCRRRRRATVGTASHRGCRRTHADGPPVYSTANPVIFDIPPTYVEHEQAPAIPQKSH